jgi:hypothetical protein
MLLFQKQFIAGIRSGSKSQTIRIWPHRKMRVGQRSYIPGVGYITVTAVDPVELADLTEDDARLDGFESVAALLAEIARLYPAGLEQGRQAFRIRFAVLSPEEQALAVAERQRKKEKSQSS